MKRQFKRLVLVFLTLVVLLTMASCRNIVGKIPFWKAFENLDLILSTSETEEQSTPVETPTQTPEESTPGPEDGTPCDHANTVVEGAVSATCTTDGHTGKTVCSDCGETISEGEVVSKLDHAMGEWEVTKQPTCGDVGTETRACTRENCAHSETRDVVATGQHEYGAWVEDTPATETTTGTKHRECTVCHNVENGTIPVLGHTHNYTAVVTDPTCTEEGYTTYTCACNDSYIGNKVNALGHKYDNDCDTTCNNTGCTETREPKHQYGELVAQKDATCAAPGMKAHFFCDVCDTYFDENKVETTKDALTIDIDDNAHAFGAWTSTGNNTHTRVCANDNTHVETEACDGGNDATCTQKSVCDTCNTAYGDFGDHNYGAWTSTGNDTHTRVCANDNTHVQTENCSGGNDATCTQKSVCGTCGEEYGELAQHTYTNWNADSTNHWKECACGTKDTQSIEAHTFVDGKCTNSNCKAIKVTVSINIADYADKHNWENNTAYSTIEFSKYVSVTALPTIGNYKNTGKYYTNGENWRIYQNENPTITFTALDGSVIATVEISYKSEETGVITLNGNKVDFTSPFTVNASSVTFSVGDTNEAEDKGQARITAIEVTYIIANGCEHNYNRVVTAPTCTKDGFITYTCSECGDSYTEAGEKATGTHTGYESDYKCDACQGVVAPAAGPLTIEQANALGNAHANKTFTEDKTYSVTGIISDIADDQKINLTIKDENGTATLYLYSLATDITLKVGDTITVSGIIGNYNGAQMKNGTITNHTPATPDPEPDPETPDTPVVGETITVTVVIGDYATANNWADATKYPSLAMDENITVTLTGGGNTGKYYNNGKNWRIYQSETPTITIAATEGKTIVSVKITYTVSNTGILTQGDIQIASGTVVTVNANSVTFSVGNTGTATNGQVRITSIEVVYAGETTACQHTNTEIVDAVDATCTTPGYTGDKVCSDCGETLEEGEATDALGHDYGELVAQKDATCAAPGMKAHFFCDVCDTYFDENKVETTKDTLTIGIDSNAHAFGAWTSTGNDTHTRVCANDHTHVETLPCSGGNNATCTQKSVCDTCGEEYGELAQHTYGTLVSKVETTHTPDKLLAGMEAHYRCIVCEGYFKADAEKTPTTESQLVIPAPKHVYNNYVCECGKVDDGHTHQYDNDCDTLCNVEGCGETRDPKHQYGELVAQKDATCTAPGMKAHFFCDVCDTYFDENKVETTKDALTIGINSNAHAFGAWTSTGNDTHTRVCANDHTHVETEACDGGNDATCTQKSVCDTCNTAYGDYGDHNYDAWTSTGNNTHTRVCANDNSHVETLPCSGGNNATCTQKSVCDTCNTAYGDYGDHSCGTLINEKPATCTQAGEKAHYTCSVCQKNFDEQKNELTSLVITAPGHNDYDADYKCDACSTVVPPKADSVLTLEQAIALGKAHEHNTFTTDKYYVTGVITDVYQTWYGNMYITNGTSSFNIYGTLSKDGSLQYGELETKPGVGDKITVYGVIGTYNGKSAQMLDGWITEHIPCEHSLEVIDHKDATCTEAGHTTQKCTKCDLYTVTETIDALGHNFSYGECINPGCDETFNATETIIFDFGANDTTKKHTDGSSIGTSKSYTAANGYKLSLTSISKVYGSAFDEKGNSCLKLGTGDNTATFTFTVPGDVTKVIIHVAKYKNNTSKITINDGTEKTLTKSSNDGLYDVIEIDTTTNKTVKIATTSSGKRAMINTIEFIIEKEHTHTSDNKATCTAPARCTVCGENVGETLEHKDTDNHICDTCNKVLSTCADSETDNDHDCDVCGKENITECADSETDNDHDCDVCGKENITECVDSETDNDHNCDVCGKENITDCADSETDNDHNCDVCGEPLSECEDAEDDNDHDCDVCGKENITDCADSETDNDHNCDVCGEPLSECEDAEDDNDHNCDVCGKELSTCADNDKDHNCDVCGKENITDCADSETDNDHNCDVCGKPLSDCEDAADDNDHNCDVCGKENITQCSGGTATCTEQAICEVCGKKYGNALNHIDENKDNLCDREDCKLALCGDDDHIEGAGEVTTAATCSSVGTRTFKCTACGETLRTEEIAIDPNAHNIVEMPGKPRTCTEDGHSVYDACTLCDYEDGKNVLKAPGHFFKVDVAAKAATCTEPGYTATERCLTCDYTKGNETIDALGHALVDVDGKAPTCTDAGYTAYKDCSRCDYIEGKEILGALGHTNAAPIIEVKVQGKYDKVVYCTVCEEATSRETFEVGEYVEVANEADLKTVLYAGYSVKLTADINLTSNINLVGEMTVVIDLNGKTITADWVDKNNVVDVLWAHADENGKAPTVTITGNGTMACGTNGYKVCVVSATDGAKITIENGTFTSGGSACIYATRNGVIIINGGTFKANRWDADNKSYLLDVNEGETLGTITVYGGEFLDFDPANHTNDGAYTNKVANGYHSIKDGNSYVVSEHEYDTTKWMTNGESHWHECECGAKSAVAAHDYTNACDTTCNACEYEREITHSFTDWANDETNHWKVCSVCDVKDDTSVEEHDFDNACDTTCNACEYEREITHSFTDWANDESNHWKVCSVCGLKNEETEEEHELAWVNTDPAKHWKVCECGAKSNEGEHTETTVDGYAATCTTPGLTDGKKCSVCEKVLVAQTTIPAGHDLVDVEEQEATCTEDGYTAHKACENCDYTEGKETILAGHKFTDNKCSVCGAIKVTVSIADYANQKGWTNAEKYASITMDANIIVSVTGTDNTGKYYTKGESWRMYQNESPAITFTTKNGATMESVKITYDVDDSGILTLNNVQIQSGMVIAAPAKSITFSVGNTGSATNGKIRITAIEVIYEECKHQFVESGRVDATCEEDGYTIEACSLCNTPNSTSLPKLGHDYSDWTQTEAPSCNKTGTETRECLRDGCDHKETNTLSMTDHNYVNDKCTVCGTYNHEHKFANDCDAECDLCDFVREVGDHQYDNTCDVNCNICGTERTITHTYDNACDTECNVCKATRETEHSYADGKCTVCGEKDPNAPTWEKVDLADIKSTDVIVIVWTTSNGKSYAVSNNNGTGSAPTAVEVTIIGDQLTSDVADTIKWNITNNNGTLTIYVNATTDTWLYCTNNNNGVRVGTGDNKTFVIDSDYLKNEGQSRYVGVYNNADVRCYTTIHANIANQTLVFYKLTASVTDGTEEPETPTCTTKCETCGKCNNDACEICEEKCECNNQSGDTPAQTTTYNFTFASKNNFTQNGETKALNNVNWTLSSTSSATFQNFNSTKGQQFGTGNAPCKTLTLTSAEFSNVSKVVINTSGASGINATVTVTVGGTQIGEAKSLTTSATDYEFTSETPLSGEIVITYTVSAKAIYIKSITVEYAE